jgi:hypothetical protein
MITEIYLQTFAHQSEIHTGHSTPDIQATLDNTALGHATIKAPRNINNKHNKQ